MPLVLREGYDAIAAAAVDVGCRFFAGYPMLPFTGLLDSFARALEPVGGVMIQADTEIEGVNMALGAAATGARAATGSTGQGVALMQEAIAEAALNELPLVVFTMGRGQQDYYQCTRGGGWGDYHTIALAPSSVVEADELTRLAFELADKWLTPVILYGDHMIGFTQMTVEHDPDRGARRAAREAVGARRQLRRHRQVEGHLDLAARASTTRPVSVPTSTGATSPTSTTRSRRSKRGTRPRISTTRATSSCRSAPPDRSSTTWSTSCAPKVTRSARSARSRCGRSRARRWPRPRPTARRCSSTS